MEVLVFDRALKKLRGQRPVGANPHRDLVRLLEAGDSTSTRYAELCLKAGLLGRYAEARAGEAAMAAEMPLAAAYAEAAGDRELLLKVLTSAIAGCRERVLSLRTLEHVLERSWHASPAIAAEVCAEFDLIRPLGLTLATDPALTQRLARKPVDPNLHLVAANLQADPRARLGRINAALARLGQAPVALHEAQRMPSVNNLASTLPSSGAAQGPKVSVIMTCYDAAGFVGAALGSVLQQSWRNLEVIVVDDGSSDATWAIVEAIARGDARVRALRALRNVGTYAAKNAAIAQASGDYVAFNDADDWAHPQRLEQAVRALEAEPSLVAVSGQYFRLEDSGRVYAPKLYPLIRWSPNSIVFRRREVLERIGYLDENRYGSDSEFVARLRAEFGEAAHRRLGAVHLIACQRAGSLTQGSLYGIDAQGYSRPRRQFEEFWGERIVHALRHDQGLYLPRCAARHARLFPAAGAQGAVQHGLPVHELAFADAG